MLPGTGTLGSRFASMSGSASVYQRVGGGIGDRPAVTGSGRLGGSGGHADC
jgi:hypothetical protein